MSNLRRPRILFFGEAVTLAHVARPVALAQALDRSRYDVFLACDPRFMKLFGDLPFKVRPIQSMSSEHFLRALRKVAPLYDAKTLRAYVKEDLEVIREIGPDLIVGDFRMSLRISAPVARCPSIAIVDAYWSPYSRQKMPIPDGPAIYQWIAKLAMPWVLAWHGHPINGVRREHDLPALQNDIRHMHIAADHILYVGIPEMIPMTDLPRSHHFLGPILWSPPVAFPEWWDRLPKDRPVVYVTLGSSGREKLLPLVFEALSECHLSLVVATTGRSLLKKIGQNIYVADYLPGDQAAARSSLVICNGGSPTSYQALAVGTPVLGLASNVDQFMNMEAISRMRAGKCLRADTATVQSIRKNVTDMLSRPAYGEAAKKLAQTFERYDAPVQFRQIVDEFFQDRPVEMA